MGRDAAGVLLVALTVLCASAWAGTGRAQTGQPRVAACIFDRASLHTSRGTCRPRARSYPAGVKTSVRRSIYDGALTFGIPYSVMLQVARCESNLDPHADDGLHMGLFQFLPSTFKQGAKALRGQTGIRARSYWNPLDAAYVAGYMFVNGQAEEWGCVPQLTPPPSAR